MVLNSYDVQALKREFDSSVPFRYLVIEGFLDPEFALEVARAYPGYEEALAQGLGFDSVNERQKVQVSDASKFSEPVAKLNDALASPEFMRDLHTITGIDGLLPDPSLAGAGMHLTTGHGRLDVHVDFNYSEETQTHRRLNILVYLNEDWDASWGGAVELWDQQVKTCHKRLEPMLNRMVLFETSDISFHGVTPLTCPPDRTRQSFATYYYTREAPAGWDGTRHSTIFRARPDEKLQKYLLMPVEKVQHEAKRAVHEAKKAVKKIVGR